MTEDKDLQKISDDLAGSDGIVYLMFLGREAYVAQIQEPLLQSKKLASRKRGLFKNKENVNQAFERLKAKGNYYLRFVKVERRAGNPQIYAARMEPVFATLTRTRVKFDRAVFESLLKSLSVLNNEFPSYLINASTLGGHVAFSPKSLTWPRTLGFYFMFLATSLYGMRARPSKSQEGTLDEAPVFRVARAMIPPAVNEQDRKRLAEVLDDNPNIAFDFLNTAMLLLFFDESAREMIPSYTVSTKPKMSREPRHEEMAVQYQFYLDTFLQFNRLIMWVFIPDHLSRPTLRNKIEKPLERMLVTAQDLDGQERSRLISDCWGSIATFWWCRDLQSNGNCDITGDACPVWPSPKNYLFRPKISPMKCQYIEESLKEFLKGRQYFDYGERIGEGKSTSMLDMLNRQGS